MQVSNECVYTACSEEAGGLGDKDSVQTNGHQVLENVIKSLTTARPLGKSWTLSDGCARNWSSLNYPGCVGRMCPDTEQPTFDKTVANALALVSSTTTAQKQVSL